MNQHKGRNDYCVNCGEFNTVLHGVCCKCGWNVIESKPATEAEMEACKSDLDDAVEQMKRVLGQ